MVATLPPPDEPSSRRIEGQLQLDRQPVEVAALGPIAPSAWPPREVKSSAQTTAVRPSMRPQPPTWLAGVKSAIVAVVVVAGEAGEAADLAEAAGIEQQRRCARGR